MRVQKKERNHYYLAALFVVTCILYFCASVKAEAAEYNLSLNDDWVDGAIVEPKSADFYDFSLPSAGAVTITYQGWNIVDSYYRILSEDWATEYYKCEVYYSSDTDPKTNSVTLMLEAGNYCVKIEGYGNHTGAYRLKGSFDPAENNETEPNNGFDAAMPLAGNTRITGLLSVQDRVDFYQIQVPSTQNVTITYTGMIKDSYYSIWNSDYVQVDRKELYYCSEESPLTGTLEVTLERGTYYIKIEPYGNNTGRYYLKWSGKKAAIPVSSIRISGRKDLTVGQSLRLTASASPANATNRAVKWTSSNKSIATVSSNGTVKARQAGSVTITATAKDGSKAKKSVTILVKPKKMTAPNLKRAGSGKLAVTWKKQAGVSGYQIQYSLKQNMKSSKTIRTGNVNNRTISNLKKNKIYYVRIRAYYKNANGAWSSVKRMRVK